MFGKLAILKAISGAKMWGRRNSQVPQPILFSNRASLELGFREEAPLWPSCLMQFHLYHSSKMGLLDQERGGRQSWGICLLGVYR